MSEAGQSYIISVLGVPYSFHHLAALSLYGEGHSFLFRDSFDALIADVSSGKADRCLLAVENSLAGAVGTNFQRVVESGLHVCAEIAIHIRLHLGALPGVRIEEIRKIYTHEMAQRETTKFFSTFPELSFIHCPSTASAAGIVAEQGLRDAGVVAGSVALQQSGLRIIAEHIDNHSNNITRFLSLSAKYTVPQTTNKQLKASLHLHFHEDKEVNVEGWLHEQFGNFAIKRLNNQELYIEADIKDSSQFDHLPLILKEQFWTVRILGVYEKAEEAAEV
jgi:prephenate dehydratase